MKALIFENKVVDLAEAEFEVHPSMQWVPAPPNCKVGWILENGIIIDSDKRNSAERAADDLRRLRGLRDKKLSQTDWWGLSDRVMTPEQIAYRQALRDITDTYTSVDNVVWPVKP